MDNNKLIAEFMGRGGTFNHDKTMICTGIYPDTMTLMKYHTEWNWLMPVVEKIFALSVADENIELFYDVQTHIPDKTATYNAVVEFIQEHNESNKMDTLPPICPIRVNK
jgi:hypothetical protein